MVAWQGAQALLPTKSAPRAPDTANKTRGNRRSIIRYDIAAKGKKGLGSGRDLSVFRGGLEVIDHKELSWRSLLL